MKLYRNFEDQEALDAAYDVEKSVPDFLRYRNFYIQGSKEARATLEGKLDVPFGPTKDEYVDVFPCGKPGAPTLIFIHGGYWKILSAKEFSVIAQAPVSSGYNVVVTNYSLCPKVSIDEITRQSRAAVAWVYRNAEALWQGNPNQIVLAGHSAGAQQAIQCTLTDWEGEYGIDAAVIKAAVCVSGLYDLRPLPYTFVQPALQLDWGQVERNSPIFHLPSKVPTLVTWGSEEPSEFRRQSADFFQAWQVQGASIDCWEQKEKNHFNSFDGFVNPKSEFWKEIEGYLRRHL